MFACIRNWASRALKPRRYLVVLTAKPTTPTKTCNSRVAPAARRLSRFIFLQQVAVQERDSC